MSTVVCGKAMKPVMTAAAALTSPGGSTQGQQASPKFGVPLQLSPKLGSPLQPAGKDSTDSQTESMCMLRILKHFPRNHVVARLASKGCTSGVPQQGSARVVVDKGEEAFPASQDSIEPERPNVSWQQRSPATPSCAGDSQGSEESWFLLEVVGLQNQKKMNINTTCRSTPNSPVTPKVTRARDELSTPLSKHRKIQ